MKFTLAAVLAATAALAANNDQPHANHRNVARNAHRNSLEKRSFSGQATYFIDGLGACGQYSQQSDFIVAMNTPQYGYGSPGPQCFKTITITDGSKTTQAQVMDECPTCGYGSLDMSAGLFQFFNPLSVGEFPITWWFGGGGDAPPPPPPPPKSTYVPPPPPKSTYVPPPPKSTWVPPPPSSTYVWVPPTSTKAWVPPTTTKAWVPPTSTKAWVPPSSSTVPTSSAAPTPSLAPGNIYNLYEAVFQLNNLVTGA